MLLFGGDDATCAVAAPALAGLGIDLVRVDAGHEIRLAAEPAPDAVLAIVTPATGAATDSSALARALRAAGVPVLLLAVDADDDALLQELRLDASVPERIVPLELAQQIRAILRRAPARVLRYGLLEIDTGSREVRVNGQAIDLSRREFDLLAFLASSPGLAFTRVDLLHAVWQSSGEWQTVSTVTEHVRRIRAKLQTRPDLPDWLVTVRGTGYRFQA